jgi:acyl-homoserine-lactone acylase
VQAADELAPAVAAAASALAASPAASTLVTYSESDNPASPHYADQTELFSQRTWATGYFCPAQVAAHALSTTVLRSQ